jgi:drug/metabolite transporter (DMT)-like permease
MDFIYPFLAVVGEAVATTIDKLNYNKNKIKPNQLLFLLFSTMTVGLLASLIFIHEPFPAMSLEVFVLIIFMIIVSFGQNFFDYVGLHTKNLSLREPINNFEPILASFLAYLLFPSERDVKYIVAILAGTIILYIGNSNRKLRLVFDVGTIYLFLGVVCSAILASVYKLGLEHASPFYLLLFRASGVLLLVQIFFTPHIKNLSKNQLVMGVGSGLIYIISNLARLYSIKYLGLNFTIMVLLLGPGLIYIGSSLILKEKITVKQIMTSLTLLAVVLWAVYL